MDDFYGAPDEAPVNWWTIFDDAALNELIDGMRINNRSLVAAVARMVLRCADGHAR